MCLIDGSLHLRRDNFELRMLKGKDPDSGKLIPHMIYCDKKTNLISKVILPQRNPTKDRTAIRQWETVEEVA